MDEEDPIADSYVMCVSSPGLDRPLKRERDFGKALGKAVDIRLYTKLNGRKELSGVLTGWDDDSVSISDKGEEMVLKRENIAMVRLHIDF